MPVKYQIRFYGFTSDDTEDFCRDLARILEITKEKAWDLLMDAPLVVKDSLDKKEARRLTDSLVSIRALCLMEPMNDEAEEDEEESEHPAPGTTALEVPAPVVKRDLLGFRIWAGILVVLGGGLLIFAAVAYMFSYQSLSRREKPAAKQPAAVTTETQAREPGSAPSETPARLTERIEELQEKLGDLRAKTKLLENEINATAGAMGTDLVELRKKQQALHAQREEIVAIENELGPLLRKRDEMQRGQ